MYILFVLNKYTKLSIYTYLKMVVVGPKKEYGYI